MKKNIRNEIRDFDTRRRSQETTPNKVKYSLDQATRKTIDAVKDIATNKPND